MLQSLKLRTRLGLIIAVSLAGLLVLATLSILAQRDSLYQAHEKRLTNLVEVAADVVEHYYGLQKSGAMTPQQARESAARTLNALRFDGSDYFYVFTGDTVGVVHPRNPKFVGMRLADSDNPVLQGLAKGIKGVVANKDNPAEAPSRMETRTAEGETVTRMVFSHYFEPWDWVLGSSMTVASVDDVVAASVTELGSIVGIVLVLVVAASLVVARSVNRQLGGEPDVAVSLMRRVAEGDLTVRARDDGEAGDESLLGALDDMVGRLRGMVSAVGRSAEQVAEEARHLAHDTEAVAQSGRSSSESTATMAAAVEEMTVNIGHISDNAKATERNSSESVESAESGSGEVAAAAEEIRSVADTLQEAVTSVSSLLQRAEEVGSIAGVIKDIAAQTNLLALNAAIESARAGEQGRGFAVVAGEVRDLAARTGEATDRIETMIQGIQAEVQGTVSVIERANPQVHASVERTEAAVARLDAIRASAQFTLERISDVANATREQSVASNSIAEQVSELSQAVESTSESMKSAAGSVQNLQHQSAALQELVVRFRY
ncbi:cache domain-containing protein [Ectothiorhodospiraceae bacterium WFHF3C12]|nr:cache domain-containing protein [Ectothiorhodospiraceae bacterium WFHF3C12]